MECDSCVSYVIDVNFNNIGDNFEEMSLKMYLYYLKITAKYNHFFMRYTNFIKNYFGIDFSSCQEELDK